MRSTTTHGELQCSGQAWKVHSDGQISTLVEHFSRALVSVQTHAEVYRSL